MKFEADPSERAASYTLFVGRADELARLGDTVPRVPVTLVVGVPGVGKSALAHAFAERWGGVVVRQRVTDAPAAALLDDVRRQLGGGVVEELGRDEDRVADLARRLAAAGGLWVLDDFHRFADADQALVLEAFVRGAGAARLLATSRHAPLPLPGLADHAQLRLDPLGEAGGRALWSALDELYGISDGFDGAWRSSHGLPLLLRQAHAGGFDRVDPIEGAVQALDADERALAGALALAEVPLPASALIAMRPRSRSRPALRRLVSRLVVDIDGAEQCTLHELFATCVRAALVDEEAAALHQLVAHALAGLELDPAIRARNVCAHLLAADRPAEAADFLTRQASELVRRGAAAELLRAIDALPAIHRSVPLRIERARALLRVPDFGRALAELRQLAATSAGTTVELRISLAQVALVTGDARLARETLVPIVECADLAPADRVRAAATLVTALSFLGEGDDGRRHVATLERELASVEPTVLPAARALTLWIEERDDEAAEALREAALPVEGEPSSYRAAVASSVFGAVMTRLGRLDEADKMLARGHQILARRTDPLFQLELSFAVALLRLESGRRVEALGELQALDDAYRRAGHLLGSFYVGHWLARALFIVGRRAEALDRLARIEPAVHLRGLRGLARSLARTRAPRSTGADPGAGGDGAGVASQPARARPRCRRCRPPPPATGGVRASSSPRTARSSPAAATRSSARWPTSATRRRRGSTATRWRRRRGWRAPSPRPRPAPPTGSTSSCRARSWRRSAGCASSRRRAGGWRRASSTRPTRW